VGIGPNTQQGAVTGGALGALAGGGDSMADDDPCMNTLTFICLKLIRWTGWLLLPVVLAFLVTGYAMSGRYGFSALTDEKTALTLHKLMHLPLGLLVLVHVVPSVYLALLRWGWIKQRRTS